MEAVAGRAAGIRGISGETKDSLRNERRLITVADSENFGSLGWSSGKEILVMPPGENKQDMPFSAKAPTESKLIGAVGAKRQERRVKVT